MIKSEKAAAAPDAVAERRLSLLLLGGVIVVAFAARLAVGMGASQFEADEANQGVMAIDLLHGHFPVVQASGHYLGAVETYVLAPFIAIFGPTKFAIRLALSVLGAATVALLYGLGVEAFNQRRAGLVLAAVAAVFPLFALSYGVKARTYGTVLFFVALCLWLATRIVRKQRGSRWSDWAAFGLAAGIGMWNHPLIVITLAICGLMLIVSGFSRGWLNTIRGLVIAVVTGLAGYSPWLIYNLRTGFSGLKSLSNASLHIGLRHALHDFLGNAIPLFLGWSGPNDCGQMRVTVAPQLADAFVIALAAGALWTRRDAIAGLVRGRLSAVEPVDFILILGLVSVVVVLTGSFNGVSCEPRYLMPFAIPLAVALTLPLLNGPVLRAVAVAAAVAAVAISAATVAAASSARDLLPYPDLPGSPGGAPVNLQAAIAALEQQHPGAVWSDYWLAGPLTYLSDDRVPSAEFLGYASFPERQARARAASDSIWLFPKGDPLIGVFESACADRQITFERSERFGFVWYQHLSTHLIPDDIGWPTSIE